MTRRSQAQADIGHDDERDVKRQKVEAAQAEDAKLEAAQGENAEVEAAVPEASADSAEPEAPETFEPRHPDLWWHDGNVIVAADDMAFKLHASILEKYSSVFEEMLNGETDEDDSEAKEEREQDDEDVDPPEIFEGCRVLRVDDPGEGLGALFQVLYDGGVGGFFNWNKPLRFEYLRQVTLLAVKYQVQHIIDEAVARLEYVFPTTFEPNRIQLYSYKGKHRGYPVLCTQDRHCLDAVNLARKINAASPPPFIVMALYQCVGLNTAGLYYPPEDDDDDDDRFLSYGDFIACVVAKEKLIAASQRVRGPALDMLENAPCANKTCRGSMERLVHDWVRDGLFADYAVLNSISGALQTHAERHPEHKFCRGCKVALTQAIDTRRREVFAELGATFGVTNWPAAAPPPAQA